MTTADTSRRWIRLLFTRELPFDGCMALWDCIFAEGVSDIVDLVCVAMVLRIRWQRKMSYLHCFISLD